MTDNQTHPSLEQHQTITTGQHHSSSEAPPTAVSQRQLPNELISIVIHYLPCVQAELYQYSLVNKHFNTIVNPLLRKCPKIRTSSARDRLINCLALADSPGHLIYNLHLLFAKWTDIHLITMLPHIPFLYHLFIGSKTSISHASLRHLPRYCPHLLSVFMFKRPLHESFVFALREHCHQLRHLGLYDCQRLPVNTFAILRTLRDLRSLALSCAPFLNHTHIVATHLQTWDALEIVKITDTTPSMLKLLLTLPDAGPTPWPRLTYVSFHRARDLDDAVWIPFVKAHHHLVAVELAGVTEMTDASLDAMGDYLGNLQEVKLNAVTRMLGPGLKRLIYTCHTLTHMALTDCNTVSPKDFLPAKVVLSSDGLQLHLHHMETIRLAEGTSAQQ